MTKYEELQEYLKNNQTTWLITGVAGFIGSNLLEKLLVLNQKVIGLDSFDTGYQKNIDEAISNYRPPVFWKEKGKYFYHRSKIEN